MTAEQLSAYIRLPYGNLIKNQPQIISTLSNFSGQRQEKVYRKPRRKVGEIMSPKLLPLPEQTLPGRWWGKYPEKINQLFSNTSQKTKRKQLTRKTCSSYRSISFRESMPPPRESVTHWPINWQSVLISSSFQELFFLVLSFCESTAREPWAISINRSLSHHCYWFHLEPIAEEHAAASFKHASYKPRTNILTSDTKGILSHSHFFTPATIINLSLLCCLKEVSLFICVTK